MGEMKLSVKSQHHGIHVVTLEGELDLYSTNDVKLAVHECLQESNPRILIDVSRLHYLDSSGVGLLISLIQRIKMKSGALQVLGLHGSPKLVLEMCKILQLIPECSTLEEGITYLSSHLPDTLKRN